MAEKKTQSLSDALKKKEEAPPQVQDLSWKENTSVHIWEGDKTSDIPTVPEGVLPDAHVNSDQVGPRDKS